MTAREKKKLSLENLRELLDGVTGIYLLNFERMTVANDFIFRKEIKELGCKYKVFKNSIIKLALADIEDINIPDELFFGQSSLIFAYDDPTAPAKLIKKRFDKDGKPVLKAACLDGQVFDGSQLDVVAALLSKDDIYSAIVGSINAPAAGIHGSINSLIRDIASMIEEVGKKNAA